MKMATNVVKTLTEDFLHCSICMNRYKVPKVLPCIHSFCQECLEKYVERLKSNKLPCPTCRKVCDLVETGVKGLQTNFHLVNLGDRMDLLERLDSSKSKSKSYTCDSCESMDVTVYCFECDFKICAKCHSQHKRFPTLRSHTVVPLNEITHPKYGQTLQNAKAPNCDVHPIESLRFYCKTCLKLICRDCTIVQHPKPDHECVEAARQLNDVKHSLSTLLGESASDFKRSLEFIKKGQAGSEEVARKSEALRQEVKISHEKMKAAIEKQLKSQMENMCTNITEAETQQKTSISEKVARASTWVTRLKNIQEVTQKLIAENNMWEILGMSSEIMSAFHVLKCDSKEFSWHQSELESSMLFYPQNVPSLNLGHCRSEYDVVLNDCDGNFILCGFDRRTSSVYLTRLRKNKDYNWEEADHIPPCKWETVGPANAKLNAALCNNELVFVGLGRSIGVFILSIKSFESVVIAKEIEFKHISWLGVKQPSDNSFYVTQFYEARVQRVYYTFTKTIIQAESYMTYSPTTHRTYHSQEQQNHVSLSGCEGTVWTIPHEHLNIGSIIPYRNFLLCTFQGKDHDEETRCYLVKQNKCTSMRLPLPELLLNAKMLSVFKGPANRKVTVNSPRASSFYAVSQSAPPNAEFTCYVLWCGNVSPSNFDQLTFVITEYDSRKGCNIRSWIVPEGGAVPAACYQDTRTGKLNVCDKYGKVTTCFEEKK